MVGAGVTRGRPKGVKLLYTSVKIFFAWKVKVKLSTLVSFICFFRNLWWAHFALRFWAISTPKIPKVPEDWISMRKKILIFFTIIHFDLLTSVGLAVERRWMVAGRPRIPGCCTEFWKTWEPLRESAWNRWGTENPKKLSASQWTLVSLGRTEPGCRSLSSCCSDSCEAVATAGTSFYWKMVWWLPLWNPCQNRGWLADFVKRCYHSSQPKTIQSYQKHAICL